MPLRQELAKHLHNNCKIFRSSLPAHSSTTFLVSASLFGTNNLEHTSFSSRSEMADEMGNFLLHISCNSRRGYSRGRGKTKKCLTSHKTKASTSVKCVRLIDQSRSWHQKARPCEGNLGVKVVIGDIHHVFRCLTLQARRPLLGARKTPVGGAERTLWIHLTYKETKSCNARGLS